MSPSIAVAAVRRSIEERSRLGRIAFDRFVRPILRPEQDGLFVAVDIDNGECEIDSDDYTAVTRLSTRNPDAEIWIMMTGRTAAYNFAGAR